MDKVKLLVIATLIVAVLALAAGITGFLLAIQAQRVALSEIEIEEHDSISLPILEQSTKKYGYISIYQLAITNHSGPDIMLSEIDKVTSGFDFIVPLKSEEIIDADLAPVAFITESTVTEIKNNPKKLKELIKNDMGASAKVDMLIKSGESKNVVIGVTVYPYDAENIPLANFVLASFSLKFSNDKTHIFRRGFPILPIQ